MLLDKNEGEETPGSHGSGSRKWEDRQEAGMGGGTCSMGRLCGQQGRCWYETLAH